MKKSLLLVALIAGSMAMQAQSYWQNLKAPANTNYFAASSNGSVIYAASTLISPPYNLFYKSTDEGANWTQITSNLPGGVLCYGLFAASSGTLFTCGVGSPNAKLYRSTDNGTTWNLVDSTHIFYNNPGFVEGSSGQLFIYNYAGSGTYAKSTDDGLTWTNPLATYKPSRIDFIGNNLYANMISGDTARKSTDGGATWTTLGKTGLPNFTDIKPFGGPNGTIYAASGDTLYKSTDGNTWSNLGFIKGGYPLCDENNNLFLVEQDPNSYQIKRSADGGSTFNNVVNGFTMDAITSFKSFISTMGGLVYAYNTKNEFYKYVGAVGISENQSAGINLFPNPVKSGNNLSFQSCNTTEIKTIELYNCNGQRCLSKGVEHSATAKVSTASLSPGLYFYVLILENEKTSSGKIVIE